MMQSPDTDSLPPARFFSRVHDPDDLPHSPMRRAFGWWMVARGEGEGGLPNVGLTETMDLDLVFGHEVTIVDVEHEPMRFRVVRTGPSVRQAVGRDLAGLYSDQIAGSDNIQDRSRWLVRERAPYFAKSRLTFACSGFRTYDVLSLPFADATRRVCRIILVLVFDEAPAPEA